MKVAIHKDICDHLNTTYKAKNSDYGDSFARVRREEGQAAILVRLKDKLYRLETLLHGADIKVEDESINDTLLDLANYCIMELVEREIDYTLKKEKEHDCHDCRYENEKSARCAICVTTLTASGRHDVPSGWEPKEVK